MASRLRIATRASDLALAQARAVAGALGGPIELTPMSTRGDHARGPLAGVGGKGLFTAELEAALRRGEVQLAVHSAKDLPADMAGDLTIAAAPARADPRDVLVSADGVSPEGLPPSARVGTSSPRRAALLRAARGDVRVAGIRGNVETRLRKLREGRFDAIVLALAGLERLGLTGELAGMLHPLPVASFVPAAGQGILAVQCLAADRATRARLEAINDPATFAALAAERGVIRRLGASCRSAVGVHVRPDPDGWTALGAVAAPDGGEIIRLDRRAAAAEAAAGTLCDALEAAGAKDML